MAWELILLDEVDEWFAQLMEEDPASAERVAAALDVLEETGPTLGRPPVDTLEGTTLSNLKELRPASPGRRTIRILFAFDPARRAILLVAGDKARQWKRWYERNVPVAEDRYGRWLHGEYGEERE